MKLQKDLKAFIALLNEKKVDYLLVDGHAVAFHGCPRFTGDIDFLIRPEPENAQRLLDALDAFGFGDLALSLNDFINPETVVQLGRPPNRIDLLTSISGLSFEDAWQDKEAGELDSLHIFFIGKASLLKNKLASGRAKDLADIEQLKRIQAAEEI